MNNFCLYWSLLFFFSNENVEMSWAVKNICKCSATSILKFNRFILMFVFFLKESDCLSVAHNQIGQPFVLWEHLRSSGFFWMPSEILCFLQWKFCFFMCHFTQDNTLFTRCILKYAAVKSQFLGYWASQITNMHPVKCMIMSR